MVDDDALWPEQWAVDASVKATAIESRMRVAWASEPHSERRQASVKAIETLLETARAATHRPRRRRRGLFDRWRGTSVGRAYQSLHAAEIFLVDLLSEDEIDAVIPRILVRDTSELERDDPRREEIRQLLEAPVRSKRAAVKGALTYLYDVSDQAYVRVRDFRNVLFVSAALIAILMIGFVIAVSQFPDTVPFCFTPSQTASDPSAPAAGVCPSGNGQPSSADVLLVAGLGLLGGALAAAFSIRNLRGTSLPYDIPIALSLLKVPSGALTAVAAILLLGGEFIPGLSELDSQRQILAYAVVFGYAQQIATRFIDKQAQDVLASVPSKEPEVAGAKPSQGSSDVAAAAVAASPAAPSQGQAQATAPSATAGAESPDGAAEGEIGEDVGHEQADDPEEGVDIRTDGDAEEAVLDEAAIAAPALDGSEGKAGVPVGPRRGRGR